MQIVNMDILDVKEGIITHQVNCQQTMNSGLAKQIRKKYPSVYNSYMKYKMMLGSVQICRVDTNLFICNFAGQNYYGRDPNICYTDYDAYHVGLPKLNNWWLESIPEFNIYFPFNIGCGLGNGDWKVISNLIEQYIPQAIICRLEK